jgi:hypothetical protein
MSVFLEYDRFSTVESASQYTSILESNSLPFELVDNRNATGLIVMTTPWDSQLVLKIREEDFEMAEKLFQAAGIVSNANPEEKHYLYSFTDDEIIDLIANQKDWAKAEVDLAIMIASERKLQLTADRLKLAKNVTQEEPFEKKQNGHPLSRAAKWFNIVGVLTIVNSVFYILKIKVYFIYGLFIGGMMTGVLTQFFGPQASGILVVNLLLAGVAFLFARAGKLKQKRAFTVGVILYAIDTMLALAFRGFLDVFFHAIVLTICISGLIHAYSEPEDSLTLD